MNLLISIKKLDLSNNNLKDQGAKELSYSLKLNQSIENLNIKKNDIFVEGGQYLVQSMLENRSIRHIKT